MIIMNMNVSSGGIGCRDLLSLLGLGMDNMDLESVYLAPWLEGQRVSIQAVQYHNHHRTERLLVTLLFGH